MKSLDSKYPTKLCLKQELELREENMCMSSCLNLRYASSSMDLDTEKSSR